jgi:hypothetical protein
VTNGAFKESLRNSETNCSILRQEAAWLTKKQASRYLGVCKSTIENLESRGMLRGRRLYLGKRKPIVRYLQSDLDNLFLRPPRGRPREEKTSFVEQN